MAILARLAFGAPVSFDDVRYDGITHLTAPTSPTRASSGSSLKLIGTAERWRTASPCACIPRSSRAPSARVGQGSFNAVTVESAAITEITMSGPGAGGSQTASAVLGDVVAAMPAAPPLPAPHARCRSSRTSSRAFYVHMEVDDQPGVLARIAGSSAMPGASIKSVVQRGTGERAQLIMVTHPLARSRLRAALEEIGELAFVRSAPRAISVIDEEFE